MDYAVLSSAIVREKPRVCLTLLTGLLLYNYIGGDYGWLSRMYVLPFSVLRD
jgi:hypothetical protein